MSNEEIIAMFAIRGTSQAAGHVGSHILILSCELKGCTWVLPAPGWYPTVDPADDPQLLYELLPALYKHLKEDHKLTRFSMDPLDRKEGQ